MVSLSDCFCVFISSPFLSCGKQSWFLLFAPENPEWLKITGSVRNGFLPPKELSIGQREAVCKYRVDIHKSVEVIDVWRGSGLFPGTPLN